MGVRRLLGAVRRFGRNLLLRTFTIVFLAPTRLALDLFGIKPMMAYYKLIAHVPFARDIVVITWQRALLQLGFTSTAAEWMNWVCSQWPHPRFRLMRLSLLRDLRRFDEASALLKQERTLYLKGGHARAFYSAIVDIEATLAIEKGDIPPSAAAFAQGRSGAIAQFCYQRAWDAHGAMNGGRVRHYLNYYFHAVDHDPETVNAACDTLLFTNALWADALAALDRAESALERKSVTWSEHVLASPPTTTQNAQWGFFKRKSKADETREGIYLRKARASFELGDYPSVRALLEGKLKSSRFHDSIAGRLMLAEGDLDGGRTLLSRAFSDPGMTPKLRGELAGELAESYEEQRDYATARQYYVSSFRVGGIPYYMPSATWRYISLCAAEGDFTEAALMLDQALPQSWKYFTMLAKQNLKQRLRTNQMIPANGAFIIGCWGIGDDIIQMAMFDALYGGKTENVRFGLSVDPRMQGLYARSFPNFEVIPISRMNGPFAVSEIEYYRLRDGLPPEIDRGRVDVNIFQAARRYPGVALTEDMKNPFFRAGPDVRRRNAPMFKVLPEKSEAAKAWLAALPPGINVGISWRSGERNVVRDKSYTDIVKDWGDVLSLKGVNFVNLQYSWLADELREAEEKFGCTIHTPPFDLKNDIEDIVALGAECDVVLAPCTAVRDMCAAAGANVWALTTTPMLPDLWRLDADRETDRLFPNMKHVTSIDYGDAQGALREIGRRLATMTAAPVVEETPRAAATN